MRVVHIRAPDVLGYATDIYVDQLLAGTNGKRAQEGLQPLSINVRLSTAASLKAQNMFTENYWAHNSPTGKTPWSFITASGYRYTIAGENLAKNFTNSQGVIDAWMGSPTHRENIMKPGYHEIGFAVVNGTLNGEETTLVVQMFGSSSAPVAQKPVQPSAEGRSIALIQPAFAPSAVPTQVLVPTVPLVAQSQPITSPLDVAGENQTANSFGGVSIKPIINLASVNKYVVYVYISIMMVVLLIDTYIVNRKRIVRVSGHNAAHFLFFGALLVLTAVSTSGTII